MEQVKSSKATPDVPVSGSNLIDMAFSQKKVEQRKQWLNRIEKGIFCDYSQVHSGGLKFSDFINKELILFSVADNLRSIPHIYDGLKPSQRKVLFACIKRNLTKVEVKVAKRPVSKRSQTANDKAKPKKNRVQKKVIQIDSSEDDFDFDDSDDGVPPPPPKEQAKIVRAGRGGRARINYALQESESEESDGFIVDDDESDF